MCSSLTYLPLAAPSANLSEESPTAELSEIHKEIFHLQQLNQSHPPIHPSQQYLHSQFQMMFQKRRSYGA